MAETRPRAALRGDLRPPPAIRRGLADPRLRPRTPARPGDPQRSRTGRIPGRPAGRLARHPRLRLHPRGPGPRHRRTRHHRAGRLGISAQHLRRLLRAEKTPIGEIRDAVRRGAAIASLRRGDESIEELARRLGFSEASAFRRAFRRWTGQSPGHYR
ncbi:helix-turn-helix transcriptional regulator [Amycolatopsis sp. FU40]|uniref:helix-turn-helix transcriptional regulator n=1 Tax=Amycolatopsis sp. FU40 TaxID=2914159 RepID=UPI00351D73FD